MENITRVVDDVFTVVSTDDTDAYTVVIKHGCDNAGIQAPYCSCIDWRRFNLPCKHMLAVFIFFPSFGWDALPLDYTSFPHFSLDRNVTVNSNANSGTFNDTVSSSNEPVTPQTPICFNI
jgi:SWIM zinc finger